jgi:hypothetical protein
MMLCPFHLCHVTDIRGFNAPVHACLLCPDLDGLVWGVDYLSHAKGFVQRMPLFQLNVPYDFPFKRVKLLSSKLNFGHKKGLLREQTKDEDDQINLNRLIHLDDI